MANRRRFLAHLLIIIVIGFVYGRECNVPDPDRCEASPQSL
jgi:hypothetical protein